MNIRKTLIALMAAGVSLSALAQNQGYIDGIEYFKVDQFDNAREILEKTLDNPDTDRATALYYLGAVALNEGDAAKAATLFSQGIEANPKAGLNYVGQGTVLLKNGDVKGAADKFKEALKAEKKPQVYVAIARAYYNADPVKYAAEYDKAIKEAQERGKKHPDYYVLTGDVLRDQAIAEGDGSDKIGAAAEEYGQAIYYDKTAPEAYVKYSRVYAKVNPNYAIDKLKELLEVVPNSALAQRELAERYYDNDQFTRAAEQYASYLQNPNHFVKDEERYTVLLYFGEKYQQSLDLANRILAKDPGNVQAGRIKFLDLDKLGRTQEAKEAADKFLALPGVKFTANDYTSYAGILNELEDYDGEIAAYEAALVVNPDKVDLYKSISSAWSQAGSRALKAQKALDPQPGEALTAEEQCARGEQKAELQQQANQNYINAAKAYQRFVDAGQGVVTQDYVDLGSRYQNVAATSVEGSAEKADAIAKAIAAIDQVIERVPNNFIPYRNKARMLLVKNDNKPSQEQVETYTKMLELLDLDPDNRTNRVDTYREGYAQIASYYIAEKDTDTAKQWYLKMLELDPDNVQLQQYIEKLK